MSTDRAARAGPGIATTTGFLRRVLATPEFRAGTHDTGLVGRLLDTPLEER